ncbi:MAG: GNAT family N-acetyltransferase [Clostridiales bacterium]|nr:GNAT family N-acetyltransferase [Clostridiales bacterium]
MSTTIETKRLKMREMNQEDYTALCKILQDNDVMYAYNGAFNDSEVQDWLDRQLARYIEYNHKFGLWAVILKETGEMIGQCGLTKQPWHDEIVLEIGYLFQKAYWHKGYATEAAIACRDYAFTRLGADEVCSIIRDTNIASQKVAQRVGMEIADSWTKHYRGVDMPHYRFKITNQKGIYNNEGN